MTATTTNGHQHRERILSCKTPPPHEINPDGIPTQLKELNQWLVWGYEWTGKRQTKVPFHHLRGYKLDVNDHLNLIDFETANKSAMVRQWGIGFGFIDCELIGLDCDGCRDPITGELAPWAAQIVRDAHSYAEVSPTGTGVKIFIRGELPPDHVKKFKRPDGQGEVEIFHGKKYFTVTGNRVPGAPKDVQHRPDDLLKIYDSLTKWNQPPTPQRQLSDAAPAQSHGCQLAPKRYQ